MVIPWWIEKQFLTIIDAWAALRPQPIPANLLLQHCKIVSHRGEHDNQTVYENTIPAFERSKRAGVWGIEFDIRWTRDLQPVVCHDPDLKRVFDIDLEIGRATLEEIKAAAPQVPSLAEVIARYGNGVHMMIEIKQEIYPDPDAQNEKLEKLFSGLTPGKDYHFLTLTPEMFPLIKFVPVETFVPIARLEVKSFSDLALRENMGGLNGHYLLITRKVMRKHRRKNQSIGTGYIGSRNCLFREINRGVEWIFSNHAVRLQTTIDQYLIP